jgi:carbon-monoxide dehydrogenase small subunit
MSRRELNLRVNGAPVQALVEPRQSLADFLREQCQLTGTHVSCEQGVCGACTVLLDGQPVRSCITLGVACEGRAVQTIEGFEDDATMEQLRQAFNREHALQCGFCTPGMLISARDIVTRLPGINETRVRYELAGNLCRCTGYVGIVRAVASSLGESGSPGTPELPAQALPAAGAFAAFNPIDVGVPAGAAHSDSTIPATSAGPGTPGAAQIEEVILVQGCGAQGLWQLLGDISAAAACIPGSRIDDFDGRKLTGRVRIAFGPIKADFAGTASVERDDATRQAVILGTGTDALSRTSASAKISYRVAADGGRPEAARLIIGMDYSVQGPLAQFSRSELVRSLVRQLVRDFGRNLETMVSGGPMTAAPAAGLNAFSLLRRWLVAKLASLFSGDGRQR